MKWYNWIIAFTWELPQTLLAIYIYFKYGKKQKPRTYKNTLIFECYQIAGISLGRFVFLHAYNFDNIKVVKHEYGHSLQSYLLGWLYLIVIGVFSIANNRLKIWNKYWKSKGWDYYSLYPERWADIWGGTDNRNK